ncbi:intermembrane transport protein PqiB [Vreelandella subglaciescola]|jgi:paraquat-inducible protein B|uniref:Paraquat-inducible protein B n=1 Tax=Vreelandella subglaciescola TaxID=29571 RepID=A0A1M7EUD9_9GAMM|nr:intermembrane transport protein PqiB [Halomonas subglaciescola]SHL95422.1 paraquat-inducible protein B [Halomonas subglaciescola]
MANDTPHNSHSEEEPSHSPRLDRAKASTQARLSPIWIIPLIAIAIGMWLIYDNYTSRGTLVRLTMDNAEGIEAGKTLIRTRNVEVGQVQSVQLSDDLSNAVIRARIHPEAEAMLTEDSRFWVVKPRIGREGISGLNTVLSGAYIQLEPGSSEEFKREFKVSDVPPIAPAGVAGLQLTIVSQLGNSLKVGDPVSYQGYTVGRVEEVNFDPDERQVSHHIFIEKPYASLVTDNTRFWNTSGIDFRLDADGIRVNLESLEALLGGGVTFGVPADLPMGQQVESSTRFSLYDGEDSARQGTFDRYIEYVLLVDDTVRGLKQGAPVEFRGVRVGTVASVPWKFTAPQPDSRSSFAIPVLVRIEPQRLGVADAHIDLDEWQTRFERLFGIGLRATLKNGNLLTGALFVDLNFQGESSDSYTAETFADVSVFPTTTGGFAQIQGQITALLDKLNGLEVDPLLTGLDRNMQAAEATLKEVQSVSESLNRLLDDPETQEVGGNLNATLKELRTTLEGLSPSSPAYQDVLSTMDRIERLLRDLQPLTKTLNENPRALLFDNLDTTDPVPRAPAAP